MTRSREVFVQLGRSTALSIRVLIWLVVGAGLAGLVVYLFRTPPVRVDLAPIERGPLRVTINAEGKTRLRQRYTVSAPVAGRLARITLQAGDRVAAGNVVARIDPLPHDTAVQSAQAKLAELHARRDGVATLRPKSYAIAQARARIAASQAAQYESEAKVGKAQAALEQARREYARAQQLERVGAISRELRESMALSETTRAKELEAAHLEAQRNRAEVAAAQAALAVLQAEQRDPDYLLEVYTAQIASVEAELKELRDTAVRSEIHAPVAGRILRVFEENERVVSAGMPLLELGDLSQLEVVIDVLSEDAVQVRAGAPVRIEDWGGERALQAQVRQVEPGAFTKTSALGVDEQRVNVIADFVEPPGALGDAYRVEAHIVVWESKAVLRVPINALFRCANGWCVYRVEHRRAQVRQVEIGRRNVAYAEVRHGLAAGERVIRYPGDRVTGGVRVKQE